MARGDHEAAVALYRGPLLDGFFLDDAPEFERWTDRERARLADSYARALEALADAAAGRRDFRDAAEWWGRRAAHDPYDSRVALSFMRALDASGRRAGALQHASVHERLLQEELGLSAAPDVRALAERMRAAPLLRPDADVAGTSARRRSTAVPAHRGGRQRGCGAAAASRCRLRRRRPAHQPSHAVACARSPSRSSVPPSIAGLAWAFRPASRAPERSIAVLPFANMGPATEKYFSDGLTEEIITRLSAVPTLKVISRTSAMRYEGSTKSLRQIAEELGVAHVLEGSVRREGDRVRITAQLIDAAADHHLWARSYDREIGNVLGVQDEIARDVGRALEVELVGAKGAPATRGTRDPEAYELYRRGRYFWGKRTKEAHELAVQYYQKAIERDSTYAEPYAGLADVYLTAYQFNLSTAPEAEIYSRLKWAAERALALDDRSADAHTSFAIALWWQRNWPGAERELLRAIELNPGHVTARNWYGLLLSGMGRVEEALQQTARSVELDPFALIPVLNHAWMCYIARDYDAAIEYIRQGDRAQ